MHQVFSVVLSAILLFSATAFGATALVYRGQGACEEGCAVAAARMATFVGLKVRFVSSNNLTPQEFEDGVIWVQPGGDAIEAAQALGLEGLGLIRRFVAAGGGYVGFCAGAFLADKTVDNAETRPGLGIIPVGTYDYPLDSNNGNGTMTPIFWNGQRRHLYFSEGASFHVGPQDPVRVLAVYGGSGQPATIETRFGKGHVVVSGAHPEAPVDWKKATGMKDMDGADFDLAVDMIRRALPR